MLSPKTLNDTQYKVKQSLKNLSVYVVLETNGLTFFEETFETLPTSIA